jgi:hypothetical protein
MKTLTGRRLIRAVATEIMGYSKRFPLRAGWNQITAESIPMICQAMSERGWMPHFRSVELKAGAPWRVGFIRLGSRKQPSVEVERESAAEALALAALQIVRLKP